MYVQKCMYVNIIVNMYKKNKHCQYVKKNVNMKKNIWIYKMYVNLMSNGAWINMLMINYISCNYLIKQLDN